MKKIAFTLAALLIFFAAPIAFASGFATGELRPAGGIHTGDTVTITDKFGDQRLLCFSDSGPCEEGNTISMDTSPKDVTEAMQLLAAFLSMSSDFENVIASPVASGMDLQATEPGAAGADILTSASLFNGGGWGSSHLVYTADPEEPSGGWFHIPTELGGQVVANVSAAFSNTETLTLIGLAVGFPLFFIFAGKLMDLFYLKPPRTEAPRGKKKRDTLHELGGSDDDRLARWNVANFGPLKRGDKNLRRKDLNL